MSILTVEGIDKTFGGLKALSGVSFSVKKGEILRSEERRVGKECR